VTLREEAATPWRSRTRARAVDQSTGGERRPVLGTFSREAAIELSKRRIARRVSFAPSLFTAVRWKRARANSETHGLISEGTETRSRGKTIREVRQ